MRKLNGMTMMLNQDPYKYLTEIFQQKNELEHIGERFTDARILDIILEDLSGEYESIRFAAERDREIWVKEIEITMRNMYVNRVARSDGSTFSREKGHQSAMSASSGFEGSRDCCSRPGHKQAQCFELLRESGEGELPSRGAGRRSWCGLHNTHLNDNANCRTQQQQRGNGSGSGSGNNRGNNSRGNSNRRRHGDGFNTVQANTAVAVNDTFSPTVMASTSTALVTVPSTPVATPPTPVTPPPTPVTSRAAPTPYVT